MEMASKTLIQEDPQPAQLSLSGFSADAYLNLLRCSCCLLGQTLCLHTTGKPKKPFGSCISVQEHNGKHLPLIQHDQIRPWIMKAEGNIVACLTSWLSAGDPTPLN